MELLVKKLSRCEYCRKPLELSVNRGSKRKFCSDSHRKYAWKKRHWTQYLSWQRDYVRRKKYLPQGTGMTNARAGAFGAGESQVSAQEQPAK